MVAKWASLADHDTSTLKETTSLLRRIRPYRQSQVKNELISKNGVISLVLVISIHFFDFHLNLFFHRRYTEIIMKVELSISL